MISNKKTNWEFCWKREYSLFYGASCLEGFQESFNDKIGRDVLVRSESVGKHFSAFSEKEGFDLLQGALLKLSAKPALVEREINKWIKRGEEFVNFAKSTKVFSKTSNKEILKIYKRLYALLRDYGDPLWVSFYIIEIAAERFRKLLEKELPSEKIEKAMEYFSVPSEKATPFIISDYFEKEKDLKKRVSFMRKNFAWIGNIDLFVQPYNEEQIISFIEGFVSKQEESAKEKFNIKDKSAVKIYQKLLFLKDKRDDYRRQGFYYGFSLVSEIARRLDISVDELGYLLPEEIFEAGITEKIRERKKGYIIEVFGKEIQIISGKEAIDSFIDIKPNINVDSFSGVVGYKGVVKGEVQVINNRSDLFSFKQGNILVAATTNIEYVSAMNKAAAFITNEGGVTCHAAIVARELKKPCIVGTKIATKVLKDGDMVEVDANKGIVRLIK